MNTELVCLHKMTRVRKMRPGSRHWKKLECANCGAFLKFLPKPENYEKRKANFFNLARLLQHGYGLAEWERQFLDGLVGLAAQSEHGLAKYSRNQQAVFDYICDMHFPLGWRQQTSHHPKKRMVTE